jgi:HSP20 family protein
MSTIPKKVFNSMGAVFLVAMLTTVSFAADDSAALKDEVAALKNKVAELEQKLNQQSPPPAAIQQNTLTQNSPNQTAPVYGQEEWNPFAEMEQMQQEMNRMFNNSVWRGQGGPNMLNQMNHFDPSADIKETKDGYEVKLDIPGMDKADMNIQVKDRQLIVSGEKKADREENNTNNKFYRRERSFGSFNRVMTLPEDANPEKVSAAYENGILIVKIGKLEGRKNDQSLKKIEIK